MAIIFLFLLANFPFHCASFENTGGLQTTDREKLLDMFVMLL
jgi:hypothetical protein